MSAIRGSIGASGPRLGPAPAAKMAAVHLARPRRPLPAGHPTALKLRPPMTANRYVVTRRAGGRLTVGQKPVKAAKTLSMF